MIRHSTDGLLFFEGGREMHIVAYDVSRTEAVVHADGLGLLPIHFYITFDNFLTVGKCRLAWRCREDIGVIFERWLDIPSSVSHSTIHSDLSPKIIPDASSPAACNLNSSHEHNCSTGPTGHSPIRRAVERELSCCDRGNRLRSERSCRWCPAAQNVWLYFRIATGHRRWDSDNAVDRCPTGRRTGCPAARLPLLRR